MLWQVIIPQEDSNQSPAAMEVDADLEAALEQLGYLEGDVEDEPEPEAHVEPPPGDEDPSDEGSP